jgi:hypothetical protein
MNQGPIGGRFMKKTRGQKSRATVPLRKGWNRHCRMICKKWRAGTDIVDWSVKKWRAGIDIVEWSVKKWWAGADFVEWSVRKWGQDPTLSIHWVIFQWSVPSSAFLYLTVRILLPTTVCIRMYRYVHNRHGSIPIISIVTIGHADHR